MFQKITKNKNFLTVAMLLVFCAFTNNTNAQTSWDISDNSSSGNNVTATLTLADSVLTISGTGNMADFWHSTEGEAPWWFSESTRNAIQKVVIQSGVKNIGVQDGGVTHRPAPRHKVSEEGASCHTSPSPD